MYSGYTVSALRITVRFGGRLAAAQSTSRSLSHLCRSHITPTRSSKLVLQRRRIPQLFSPFSTTCHNSASATTADALMENLTELYATAKDEFEIAAEETEKKTVYAAEDREAAVDALKMLQDGYDKAIRESSPEVSKEIQSRVGQRIRELQNAIKAMEEMAMED